MKKEPKEKSFGKRAAKFFNIYGIQRRNFRVFVENVLEYLSVCPLYRELVV